MLKPTMPIYTATFPKIYGNIIFSTEGHCPLRPPFRITFDLICSFFTTPPRRVGHVSDQYSRSIYSSYKFATIKHEFLLEY